MEIGIKRVDATRIDPRSGLISKGVLEGSGGILDNGGILEQKQPNYNDIFNTLTQAAGILVIVGAIIALAPEFVPAAAVTVATKSAEALAGSQLSQMAAGVARGGTVLLANFIIVSIVKAAVDKGDESGDSVSDKYPWSELPTSGEHPFEPQVDKSGSPILEKGAHGGMLDKDGNEWRLDKQGVAVGNPHWDVEHEDGSHTNVNPQSNNPGGINHGKNNFKGGKK